jgi:O-antigen/teichoic acid export membrane protein
VTAPQYSLRRGFAWTVAGNVANGFSQWAVLSAIAKLASPAVLGEYALALAVAMPVALFSHLNLRAVLATDVGAAHPFGDYARVRHTANVGALIVLAALAMWHGLPVLIVGTSILVDNTIDLLYGWHQRNGRLDEVARSMTLRAGVSVVLVVVFVYVWRSATAATAGLLAGRLISLAAWDLRRTEIPPMQLRAPWVVLRDALPLGFTQMLIALTASLPRYAVERSAGTRELGVFAAVASFLTVGSVVVNSLGQSAMTRLAEYRRAGNATLFLRTSLRMTAGIAGLGVVAVACAVLLGDWVLTVLYTSEYAAYQDVLVATLAAGSIGWVAQTLGFVTTSARAFRAQLVLPLCRASDCTERRSRSLFPGSSALPARELS